MTLPGYAGSSDYRRPSLNLWHDCPVGDKGGFGLIGEGSFLFDDFTEGIITGKQVATAATSGTFAMDDQVNGVAILDSGATTAHQGIQVQWGGGSTTGEIYKPAAGKKIWLEALLKFTASSTGPEFALGFSIQDTTLIATGALSSQFLGIKSLTSNNVLLGTAKDGSSETATATIGTVTDATWTKLGLKVTGTGLIEFYFNGVKSTVTATANIPTTELKPVIVCQSSGTTQPTIQLDWIRAFGQR
jgi:hypothetical protein